MLVFVYKSSVDVDNRAAVSSCSEVFVHDWTAVILQKNFAEIINSVERFQMVPYYVSQFNGSHEVEKRKSSFETVVFSFNTFHVLVYCTVKVQTVPLKRHDERVQFGSHHYDRSHQV